MKIQVLGRGCSKCHQVEENTRQAVEQADRTVDVETVYDLAEATSMGLMEAPGLAVDEELKIQGRVPDAEEIIDLIESS